MKLRWMLDVKGNLSKQECLFSFLQVSVPWHWAAVLKMKMMQFTLSCLPPQVRGLKLFGV